MKRTILLLLALTAASLQAKPVDPELLLAAARQVLGRADVVDVTPAAFTDCRLYVGADGTGFVLLSDDNCVRPLLGYSPTETFPTQDIPAHVAAWVDAYCREIASAKAAGSQPSARATDEWNRLLAAAAPRKSGTAVEPLLKTRWGQDGYYNYQCPYDSAEGQRCATGCVATAAAQLMRYWHHPVSGRGSHSYTHATYGTLSADYGDTRYEWSRMPNDFSGMATQGRIDAVSQLMYHVGVAVEMNYGPFSSGAYCNPLGNVRRASSETALKEFFYYNPGLFTAYKEGFSDAEWRALIDADLDAGRPVLYDGYGPSGGHAFVLDGRDSLGLYHFNWGWDGYANGFFTLDSLSPTSTASFSQLNAAVVHIYPVTPGAETAVITGVSADPLRGSVSGSGIYSADTMRAYLLATATTGYRFDHWTSGNPANPIITSPTADFSDTAVFVPMHRDSVGYCRRNGIAYKNLTDRQENEWGIRIPAMYLEGKQRLREVHFWTYETTSSPYYLHLYRGALPDGEPFYTDSLMAAGYGMNIYPIPASLDIDFTDTTPLWITIYSQGSPFPMSYSHYTGTPDGSWVKCDSVWTHTYDALHLYASWMLRAVLDPSTHVGLAEVADATPIDVSLAGRTVDIQAAGPVALYDVQGRLLQASSTGRLRCTLPAAGVYILRSGPTSRKIIVY